MAKQSSGAPITGKDSPGNGPSKRFANRRSLEPADWASADGPQLCKAVSAVCKNGGAIRLGYTRDGGAYAVGIMGDGDPYTLYCSPRESLTDFLNDIINQFESM